MLINIRSSLQIDNVRSVYITAKNNLPYILENCMPLSFNLDSDLWYVICMLVQILPLAQLPAYQL